jgi:SAM-dependent methyltransferase
VNRAERRRRIDAVGGFEPNDLTIDFSERVRAIAPDKARIVDFGAGRGEWLDDPSPHRRRIADLRDIAERLVGVDVAPAVMTNPSLDEAFVIDGESPLPIEDGWADVVVTNWVIEHVDDPAWFVDECSRIVKPGGWLCGRTPNKVGYIGLGARLVPNRRHVGVLRRLQPDRKAEDVFPTRYKLNTVADLGAAFGDGWDDLSFAVWPNLAYGGHSSVMERGERLWRAVAPDRLAPVLYVFLRRR